MKNLIIIGAGQFGREVYAWAKQTQEYEVEWQIKGFLDDRKDALKNFNYAVPIIAPCEKYMPELGDIFIPAIGNPGDKKRCCAIILGRGGFFTNIVHPTVVFGENCKIGTGVVLCPYSVVSCEAVIGNFVSVNLHVTVGHDVVIGDYSQINPNVSLGGFSVLKEGVVIGSNASILPEAVVEDFAVVGAGSVVLRKVKTHQTVFGVPANPIVSPKMPNP